MTPRALLTSIGATAVAFAVAIGVAAGSAIDVNTAQSSRIALAASAAEDRVNADERSGDPSTESQRLASWNDPCAIAV